MNFDIEKILEKIYYEVSSKRLHPALLGGASGVVLFKILYLKYFGNEAYDEQISLDIENIVLDSRDLSIPTFCSGKAGINWFFSYLQTTDMITKRQQNVVCHDDRDLMSKSLAYLSLGNYDFLHGALGIAYYILYRRPIYHKQYIKSVLKHLNRLTENEYGTLFFYDFAEERISHDEVSLGLSHGLPSVIKFCIECYRSELFKDGSRDLAYKVINFIIKHMNTEQSISSFPQVVTNIVQDQESRLGWCYGDLSTGYILLQAAKTFGDDALYSLALKVLKKTTSRRLYNDTQIQDVSICHGYIGVAHIYEKIGHLTNLELFRETADYWLNKALSIETYEQDKGAFLKFDRQNNNYVQSLGVLEGSAGYGLCLISRLTGDYSWDYCLMLN